MTQQLRLAGECDSIRPCLIAVHQQTLFNYKYLLELQAMRTLIISTTSSAYMFCNRPYYESPYCHCWSKVALAEQYLWLILNKLRSDSKVRLLIIV